HHLTEGRRSASPRLVADRHAVPRGRLGVRRRGMTLFSWDGFPTRPPWPDGLETRPTTKGGRKEKPEAPSRGLAQPRWPLRVYWEDTSKPYPRASFAIRLRTLAPHILAL